MPKIDSNDIPTLADAAETDIALGYRPSLPTATNPANKWTFATLRNFFLGGLTWLTTGGRTSAATARADLGLGNVDNTADVDKPVSTAQAAADTAVASTAATDATTKANAAQSAAISAAATDATTKANAAQAFAVQRDNHTGTQPASTISDFAAAVAATAAVTANTAKVSNAEHTGDVTGATVLTIADNAVTNAKAADMATGTIKGRSTAGTGDPEDLTPAQARTLLAVATEAETLSRIAALQPADYIQMDGATANRAAGIYGPFDATINRRGWIAGVPTVQLAIDLPRLTLAPTTRSHIAGFYSGASGSVDAGEVASLFAYINATTGNLVLRINSTVDASNRTITLDSFVTTFMTERRKLLITFSGGGTPVVSLDGVDITGLFGPETTGGASPPADWSLSNLSPVFFVSGLGWPAAQAPLVTPILGTLSAAEAALWFSTGQLPAWVVSGGGAASITAGSFVVRTEYVISAVGTTDFTLIGAASNTVGVRFNATGVGTGTGTAIRAGALTIPVVQPCLVVGDGTLIGDNCGRILGGIPVTNKDRYRIVARTHTTSAENVQLLGGNILLEANRSRIDSIAAVQNSGGNLNLEIGSASGSANIAASTSIVNGSVPTEVSPALRYVPTQTLWARRVAGAGTAPFTITVEGHRVAANP